MHMTRHEDRFVVHSRVTREFPGKICERLQRHTRASVKFKLSGTVAPIQDLGLDLGLQPILEIPISMGLLTG